MRHATLPSSMIGAALLLLSAAADASAQTIGAFRWQLQPYCNIVTLNVTYAGAVYTLDGVDNQCGAKRAASVVGLAYLNPDGTVGFGLTTVEPAGGAVHVTAAISLASLGGTWRDSAGNSGAFVFTPGAGTGGSLRPVPPNGIAPGSITAAQIASAAVGAPQLAADSVTGANIVNGSITAADLLDAPRAAYTSGDQFVALTPVAAVVRTVSITAPAAGRVIVSATGYFAFLDLAVADTGRCSITTGIAIDFTHLITAAEQAASAMALVPFAGTRGYDVGAGTTAFNLVCDELKGNVIVEDTSLSAIYVPGS